MDDTDSKSCRLSRLLPVTVVFVAAVEKNRNLLTLEAVFFLSLTGWSPKFKSVF